jgi:hypothetical protein
VILSVAIICVLGFCSFFIFCYNTSLRSIVAPVPANCDYTILNCTVLNYSIPVLYHTMLCCLCDLPAAGGY